MTEFWQAVIQGAQVGLVLLGCFVMACMALSGFYLRSQTEDSALPPVRRLVLYAALLTLVLAFGLVVFK